MVKILEIDLRDPLCPLKVDDDSISTVPFYYPLSFDFGGGEVQYTLKSDNEIHLFNTPIEDEDYEEYPYPEELPEHPVSLVPLSYEEFRALTVWDVNYAYETPDSDKTILDRIDSSHIIRIGGSINPPYGSIQWQCKNQECKWSEIEAAAGMIASIPSEPIEGLDMWGADGWGPDIYFCLCRSCKTIFTVNRCT